MPPMTTAREFYAFFAAIPDQRWHEGAYRDPDDPECRCAYGHLGVTEGSEAYSGEANALASLIGQLDARPEQVNDGRLWDPAWGEMPPSPKARILRVLDLAAQRGL